MGRNRIAVVAAAAGLAAASGWADHGPLGPIEPSADEQLGIYELNRARNDPPAYGTEIDFDLTGVAPRPPLAVNPLLSGSARFHAQVMFDHHEYGHTSVLYGIGPNQMAVNNGYDVFGAGLGNNWTTVNTIESIMRSVNQVATTPAAVKTFIIDKDVPGAGHRVHLLAIAGSASHREIGFGWTAGVDSFPEFGLNKPLPTKLCAIHTAYESEGDTFVTGVVFRDANGNRRYDKGEGIGGATVDVGDGEWTTVSMANGGYSVEVNAGIHLVTCSGGAFAGTSQALVTVGDDNVEVDFHSGRSTGEVDFAWRGGIGAGPTVTATAAPASGVSPLSVDFAGSGIGTGIYLWDFSDGTDAQGAEPSHLFGGPGLYPVIATGIDATGSGRGLALVTVQDPAFPGEGLTAPADGSLHIVKGALKRVIKVAGKDQAKLSATLEVPGGFLPEGQEVQVCVAGALRTFTLDAKGKGALPDGSKISLKAKWPTDGPGAPAGTIAKVTATLKGDLAAALDAGGLRDRTEARSLGGVPAAVHLAGGNWTAPGTLATKAVEGKGGKGTLLPE